MTAWPFVAMKNTLIVKGKRSISLLGKRPHSKEQADNYMDFHPEK